MDCLLSEVEQSWRLAKMVEGECNQVIQELSLTSNQLSTKKARVEIVEASMASMSAHLDESIVSVWSSTSC